MKKRKTAAFFMTLSLLVSFTVPAGFSDNAQIADDPEFEALLDEQGFPESYRAGLRELHKIHPNWTFLSFDTGLDWEYVLNQDNGEMYPRRNLIPYTPYVPGYESSLFDTTMDISFDWLNNEYIVQSDPYWVQCSRECVEYYLDPRNFFNEERVFMFELLTYNEGTQTLEGVQKILKGCFMDGAYIDKNGTTDVENPYIASESLLVTNKYVTGIEPGTTTSDLLAFIQVKENVASCKILNTDDSLKEENEPLGTGDIIRITSNEGYSASFPIIIFGDVNGDGSIDATDRSYYKAYLDGLVYLSEVQLKAADADQDGDVDAEDTVSIKDHVFGAEEVSQEQKTDMITYAEAFFEIGKELNISPYHLAFRVRLEQGRGKQAQISGTYPGYENYYNYFNINAGGITRDEITINGLNCAVQKGWNSRYKALYGGAAHIREAFIGVGQDTLYLQKFDVEKDHYRLFYHQYMQNILSPYTEGYSTYNTYKEYDALDANYTFKIPIYNNMPESPCPRPVKDGNPNNHLKSLEVEGYSVDFAHDTFEYEISVPGNVTALTVSAQVIADTSGISAEGTVEKDKATGIVTITFELDEETNIVTVSVTAENGDVKDYNIKLKRIEPTKTEELKISGA
ncbi:MAG: cadherin-like beta sandwich domain-containing protein [Lachnospiraceae bacterium]|nr:cadherin-like beta sandwich domain-containing protein [Lachnospiraceae bacterium]